MATDALAAPATGSGTTPDPERSRKKPPRTPLGVGLLSSKRGGTALGLGGAMIYLSLIVLIPLAAVVWRSTGQGPGFFWRAVRTPDAWAALKLTIVASVIVALINLVMGT